MDAAIHDSQPLASRAVLREAIRAEAHQASILADAHHECSYALIPGFLDAIQEHLARCGVQAGDCLTLELANSVPAALTVLACIDAGYSMTLMPMEGLGARAVGSAFPVPRFSKWIVTPSAGVEAGMRDLAAPSTYLDVRPNPDHDATATRTSDGTRLYLRTSGSLGAPKLVTRRLEHFLTNVLDARERLRLNHTHRVALPIPIFHAFGLGPAFLGCILAGASIDLQERANLLRYLQREREFRPNVAFVTPSFCEILVRGRRAPRAYEFMITGGDRIASTTFFRSEELHGPLINACGSTEMGFIFSGDLDMPAELRCRTVGRPLPGVRFRITENAETSDPTVGSLQIQYAHAFDGYVDLNGDPLHPENVFDGDWYCTSDIARPGPDGTVEVLGRSDLSVNRNGLLLTFADLEAALRAIDGVEEAGVAAGPEGIRGQMLVAFCALERGSNHSEADLRARLASQVPAFAVPEHIRLVASLPRLSNGKIDRKQLATWARSETHADAALINTAT